MKKRLLALLLAVVMIAGMIPTIAAVDPMPAVIHPDTTHRATYTFYAGGTEVDKQIVKDGEYLTEPAAPTGEGKFLGWYVEDAENPLDFTQAVTVSETGTVKVFAHFDEVQYVLFMDEKKERVVDCKTLRAGDTVQTSDVTYPVGADQSVIRWNDADGMPVDEVRYGDAIDVLYAVVEDGHWLTFETNGGSYIAPQFFTGIPTEPTSPTKPGYTFSGWYLDEKCTNKADFSNIDSSTTVYANWIPKNSVKYTVLHMQENANDNGYSTKDIETKLGEAGFHTDAKAMSYQGFTAQNITQQTIAGDGTTIVTVKYKRNVYEVKFFSNSGLFTSSKEYTALRITAKYGANISDKWPTYNGSSTWATTNNGSTYQVNIETMPLRGASFYGPLTGYGSETAYYYVEILPGEDAVETKNGIDYKLHHKDTSPGTGYDVTQNDKYDITGFTYKEGTKNGASYNNAKFYYTRNSYNLIFISGGKEVKTANDKYGASISGYADFVPATPPAGMDGYVFGGWYDNEQGVGAAYDFTGKTMPAQNITLHAKWVAPVHTVTFWLDTTAESPLKKIEDIPHGTTITEEDAPTVTVGENEEFYGWTLEDGTPFNFNTEIRNSYDLYAKVGSKAGYKLTYDVGGNTGTVVDPKHYAKNTDAVIMNCDAGIPAGKVFLGWATTADGNVAYKPGATIEMIDDTTLHAVFGDKTGTVSLTYHSNFGTDDAKYTVDEIANNGLVAVLGYAATGMTTREGHSFRGWNTKADGTGYTYAEGDSAVIDNVNADTTNHLYAVWQINTYSYTVEYYIDGIMDDSKTENSTADFGAVIDSYLNKCPDGYKLDKTENFPLTIGTDVSANVIKVYYIKDESQTKETKYTVKYTINGVEQTADEIEVTGTAWINDNPAQIEIAAGGIPTPADKYTGYKLDPSNPEYPAEGTLVNSGTVYTVNYVKDDSLTQPTNYIVKYTINNVEQEADRLTVTGTAWINDNPAQIAIAEGGIPAPANKYTGYKLDPNNPAYPAAGTLVNSGSEYTVNYVKDESQTKETKYTVKYTLEGVEQTADKIEVTGTAWVNDDPAKIAIAAGGIPTPANKYTGYKLDPSNPAYPAAGTLVNSGTVYTVNYVKDESQTKGTKYTVKYTIEGVEQTADKLEVTGTAWINDNPAQIAIAEGGIPAPANKYTGYKLDPSNPAYPAAGTLVNSGTIFVVNYIKKENPTPATFDPNDIGGEPIAEKYLIVNRGSAPEETFEVVIKQLRGEQMSDGEATLSGKGGRKDFTGFEKLTYTAAGTYYYTIGETDNNTRYMRYDSSLYTLTVVVIEGRDGLAVSNVYYTDDAGKVFRSFPIAFNNTYDRKTGTVVIPTTPSQLNTDDHYAYVIGYPDGSVHPNGEITRAEVAAIFFRLLRDDVRSANFTTYNAYTDVSADKWYNNPISTMSRLGIIKGYPDGTFRPNDPITRAEFAAIAARFDEHKAAKLASFTDIYGHWAVSEISLAYENGWIKGYNDGTFRPNRNITRAEAMALINRVLNRAPEKPSDLLNNMNKWTDNMDTTKWYYLDVQEATNSHDYTRKTNNYEMWKKMLTDPDWAKYER